MCSPPSHPASKEHGLRVGTICANIHGIVRHRPKRTVNPYAEWERPLGFDRVFGPEYCGQGKLERTSVALYWQEHWMRARIS